MPELSYKLVTNDGELKAALAVRRQVFVVEQGVTEELEYDGHDREALHMVVKDGRRVIATARVLFVAANEAKIERMAVLKSFRRRGVGRGIISFLTQELRKKQVQQIVLHAQYAVAAFYRACGFAESGLPFQEAGIKHIRMERQL